MNAEKNKQVIVRIPEELHRQAKVLSAQTGKPLQQVLEKLIAEWVAKEQAKQASK